jgi:hypothetical protein
MAKPDTITLGSRIKGGRLGFHPVGETLLVRVSDGPVDLGMPLWVMDVRRPSQLPRGPGGDREYRIWWDDPETVEQVGRIARRLGPGRYLLNDVGGVVRPRTSGSVSI